MIMNSIFCLVAACGLQFFDLQARIDAAADAGGGTVTVEKGEWTAKPFVLRSNVTLELKEGAIVSASTNLAGHAERRIISAELPVPSCDRCAWSCPSWT